MITKKVFLDLSIFMIGFGVLVGLIFPFFAIAMGIPQEYILTPAFILSCISAGIFVGLFGFLIASKVVGKRIRLLSRKMTHITGIVAQRSIGEYSTDCEESNCYIEVSSQDDLGETAKAFNSLVKSLSISYRTENNLKLFNNVISSKLELKELCDVALDSFVGHSMSSGGLLIIDQNGELGTVSCRGIKEPENLLENEIIWRVLRTRKVEVIKFPKDIIVDGMLVSYHPKEVMFLPICHKEVSLGILVLVTTSSYSMQMLNDLSLLNNNFSLALKNSLSYSQIQKLAANDPLTNVFNRRFGMIRLNEEFNRSVRTNSPLGVFMADIDFFKSVNDTYGHTVGDRVLIHFSALAKQSLREGDILVRYGGEEFMAILPGASIKDTAMVSERFRRMLQESVVHHLENEIKITVSIGVASYPNHSISKIEDLVDIADKALYKAKDNGRNCVM